MRQARLSPEEGALPAQLLLQGCSKGMFFPAGSKARLEIPQACHRDIHAMVERKRIISFSYAMGLLPSAGMNHICILMFARLLHCAMHQQFLLQ